MTSQTTPPTLASLDAFSYIDDEGRIPTHIEGKVGIYAIFDQDHQLNYVGYSRDIYLSLKQHLIRQPQACYWVKVQTVARPSRTLLEGIRDAWIAENGSVPSGNDSKANAWNQPIDAKLSMTEEDKAAYEQSEDLGRMKLLKKISRRVEAEILQVLEARGLKMDLRFNPKLKENGLLDLK